MSRTYLRSLMWVPSLYLAMGIPYNIIMGGTAARMYKSLGYSDGQITVALGSIGVAWSLKPVWAAFLDMYGTKKFFVIAMELLIAVLLICVAMILPTSGFFQVSIALFWVAAFASSTQDICADGIYLSTLAKPDQARMAGVQGMFWLLGKIIATGVLISVLDRVKTAQGWPEQRMWVVVMIASAVVMVLLSVLHASTLPTGRTARKPQGVREVVAEFRETAVSFFQKRMFWGMIGFVFLYRLGEGLILMEGQLFLQSEVTRGGLGLTAGQVSDIDAVWGTGFTLIGSLLGGFFVSRFGLARTIVILALCLNVPHLTYVYLSQAAATGHGLSYATIATMVSIEKFGYGFGFVGNMIYMMQQLAPGRCTMTHYAFATALMNLMMVPTNMISGPLAERLGFSTFFLVVMVASVPSVWAAWKAPFPVKNDDPADGEVPATGVTSSTSDDLTRFGDTERRVQVLAGRASIYAMLNVLTILLIDTRALGTLQSEGPGWIPLSVLVASVGLKLYFTHRTYRIAGSAENETDHAQGCVYLGNARGAKAVTIICGAASCAVLVLAAKLTL